MTFYKEKKVQKMLLKPKPFPFYRNIYVFVTTQVLKRSVFSVRSGKWE